MASPIPKPAAQRQRRNRTVTAASLEAGPAIKAPLPTRYSSLRCAACPLPRYQHVRMHFAKREIEAHDYVPREIEWRPPTVSWWETIWASPMVDEWVDADVPGLLALAVLVDEFWTFGEAKIHAEMRQAAREFGLSPLSRRQLQWEIKRVQAATHPADSRPRRPRGRAALGILTGGKARSA